MQPLQACTPRQPPQCLWPKQHPQLRALGAAAMDGVLHPRKVRTSRAVAPAASDCPHRGCLEVHTFLRPDVRVPTTPLVSLPPGRQSPPGSDVDSSLSGFRSVDCPLRLRVMAFACLREDDKDWIDGWRTQLSSSATRHAHLYTYQEPAPKLLQQSHVCFSLNSLSRGTLWMGDVNSTQLSQRHLHAFFLVQCYFRLKTFSSCFVHKKNSRHRHLRHVHDFADTQETHSTTTTADSTSKSTNAQALHVTGHLPPEANSAQCDHENGRLVMSSPRARCQHNMAGTLTPPTTQLTNTSSRQHRTEQIQADPCFSRHERKATFERVSITRNKDDTPLTLLVGSGTPAAGCRVTSEKQVGTWFAQGKDQSPMKEGELRSSSK